MSNTPLHHPSHFQPGHTDKVEAIRAYVVGTTLTNREIAARLRVSATTVSRLKRQHGWEGPPGRRQIRERGWPNGPELVEAIWTLVVESTLTYAEIAVRLRVSTATIWRLQRQHGWEGLPGPQARRRLGQPYRPEIVEAVRALVEGTTLPSRERAARTGVCSAMGCRWRRLRGWRRPEDAAEHRNPSPPHAEVPAEGWPRRMHGRRASFEAPLRGAPQDEDVGRSESGSRDGAVSARPGVSGSWGARGAGWGRSGRVRWRRRA